MKLPIYPAGWPWIIASSCATVVLIFLVFQFPYPAFLTFLAFLAFLAFLTFFLIIFFRDPERRPDPQGLARLKSGEYPILSPADGTITDITEISDPSPLTPHPCLRIGIFLSPLNCHVQRSPLEGAVKNITRKNGRFRPAYSPDASEINASTTIEITHHVLDNCRVRQIVGLLARRILTTAEPGDSLKLGERLGMILLGSRVELEVPKNKIRLLTAKGARIYAGQTIIAAYTSQ
ncbi:MAG: phosphatidylserine decarboxylase [Elusimicrobia bacterium]|nr:phosphatidylserine decarboxylase [Elusimicrobiota bacterium]